MVRDEAREGGTPLKEEAGEGAYLLCLLKGTLDPAEEGVEGGPWMQEGQFGGSGTTQ